MPANLLLHCGASAVSRGDLETCPTPMPTRSWCPLPHIRLLTRVEELLPRFGMAVRNQAHGLTHDGSRYFGLLEVSGDNSGESTRVLGLRNSHDQSLPAGLVAGSQVLVCDNLCFSGEVKVSRKHTRYIMRDLPDLLEQAMSRVLGFWHRDRQRREAYRNARISDRVFHDLAIRSVDADIIPASRIPKLLDEWRRPSHAEFLPRTAWSAVNAFTEVLKGNLPRLPAKTERLNRLMDARVGLN